MLTNGSLDERPDFWVCSRKVTTDLDQDFSGSREVFCESDIFAADIVLDSFPVMLWSEAFGGWNCSG